MPKLINLSKIMAAGAGLLAVGYSLGILTAPRSGSATRNKLAYQAKKTKIDVERELSSVYEQTKKSLKNLAKENPKLTSKVKAVKEAAEDSQKKIKDLISATQGSGQLDEDLDAALNNAKKALSDLKSYISK
jgi:gas vesicle protein